MVPLQITDLSKPTWEKSKLSCYVFCIGRLVLVSSVLSIMTLRKCISCCYNKCKQAERDLHGVGISFVRAAKTVTFCK